MTKSTKNDTCVYIHTRFCDGVVFYVGIGTLKRAEEVAKRNQHWQRTIEKYGYTVTILHENLSWGQACAIEIELIKKYRALSGDKLCNVTAGGDGAKGNIHAESSKELMRIAALGRERSPHTRAKISAAKRNPSDEARANMRNAQLGTKRPLDIKEKISASMLGKKKSEETKFNMSLAQKISWAKRKELQNA